MPLPSELGLPIPDPDEIDSHMIYQPRLVMDLAKSSAAACRTCSSKFAKGDPRMGIVFNAYSDGIFYDSPTTWYYHVKCGINKFKTHFALKEVANLNAVPKKEQDMIKKAFPAKMAAPKVKAEPKAKGKAKAEPKTPPKAKAKPEPKSSGVKRKADSNPAAASKAAKTSCYLPQTANVKAFMSKKDEVSGWTNDKLKKALKANDQSQSGNKGVLVDKVAFGMAFGKLPRCPSCHGGRVKFRVIGEDGKLVSLTTKHGGSAKEVEAEQKNETADTEREMYYCTGYFDDDEKVDCEWQSDNVELENWVDP